MTPEVFAPNQNYLFLSFPMGLNECVTEHIHHFNVFTDSINSLEDPALESVRSRTLVLDLSSRPDIDERQVAYDLVQLGVDMCVPII